MRSVVLIAVLAMLSFAAPATAQPTPTSPDTAANNPSMSGAIAVYSDAIRRDPDDANAQLARANIYMTQKA